MSVSLHAVPASHPSGCVEAALRLKEIPYRRIDLPIPLHKVIQQARFGRPTVPGLDTGSERIVGSREILAWLDENVPSPSLRPSDQDRRAQVEEAERWGEQVLQPAARRIVYGALRRHSRALASYVKGSNLPMPLAAVHLSRGPIVALGARINGADDLVVREDMHELPGWLDAVDEWIDAGVLGGDEPNVADLQIGASLRLLLTLGDVGPLLDDRPCARLARRHFPEFPGEVPARVMPDEWFHGLWRSDE